ILQRQRRYYDRLYPAMTHLISRIQQRAFLWERRPYDADFLEVRVGAGVVPLCSHVLLDTGSNPLADFDTELMPKAQSLISRFEQVDDAPQTIPLHNLSSLVICGQRNATRSLLRAMFCNIAASHAPDDVRFMTVFPRDATPEWAWLKWLPHSRRLRQVRAENQQQGDPLCLMADNVEDFQSLLASQIIPELERRQKLLDGKKDGSKETQTMTPHFLVVLDGFTPKGPLARIPALEELFQKGAKLGLTIICIVEDRGEEPSVAQGRLEITPGGWMSFAETSFGGKRLEYIQPDTARLDECERIARSLAPLVLSEKDAQQDLSQDVRLLRLLDIPSADDVQVTQTWQPRSRDLLLNAPIGTCEDGTPLMLNIKESAEGGMGPHGLVIGATGSGKSELLRTIVTSLAITHDPETLSFVLADFKGGAAFADLASLPHAAGMISNLQSDLSQVDRMRASLFGEQERRQTMLREAGNLDNIRQYHAKRMQNPDMEPMPYLMIIVDEFAELLTARPDFLELFIAIGRVGRSLGMHLLLATQRLSEGR
ncbi:MAG TPA: FtsK/SpoIIIE domain-containing protein, partial [Ktedonobacterales bacterium]|nr:FtsK/SpoIIIE domain-containing protein [Ktedonobacterales bacterium]